MSGLFKVLDLTSPSESEEVIEIELDSAESESKKYASLSSQSQSQDSSDDGSDDSDREEKEEKGAKSSSRYDSSPAKRKFSDLGLVKVVDKIIIPLREQRSGTGEQHSTHGMRIIRNGNITTVTESSVEDKHFRSRIWPSKAALQFCQLITRCDPPLGLEIGVRLPSNRESRNRKPLGLKPFWKASNCKEVPSQFDGYVSHNTAFIWPLLQEALESAFNGDRLEDKERRGEDISRKNIPSSSSYSSKYSAPGNGWLCGEVISARIHPACTESFKGKNDSIWSIRMSVHQYCNNLGELNSNSTDKGSTAISAGDNLQGGDVLFLTRYDWERPILALVPGWDPDTDINMTGMAPARTAGANTGSQFVRERDEAASILLCVHSKNENDFSGGWAPQGLIEIGVRFHVVILGNMLTSLRECQALLSLKHINQPLQQVVLNPEKAIVENNKLKMVEGDNDKTIMRPDNVPELLWASLVSSHNPSQLQAIKACCFLSTREHVRPLESAVLSSDSSVSYTEPGAPAPLSLLQGPPGTGKTKTILAMVASLLVGGANKPEKKRKILRGAVTIKGQSSPARKGTEPRLMLAQRDGVNHGKPRVLVCAPSNTAVDEIAFRVLTEGILGEDGVPMGGIGSRGLSQRLRGEGINLIRIGAAGGERKMRGRNASNDNTRTNLVIKTVNERGLENLVDVKRQAFQNERSSSSQKANDREFRRVWNSHGGKDGNGGDTCGTVMDLKKHYLYDADVVCATLSGAGSQVLVELVMQMPDFRFDAVIVDEACQAVEPSALIPFKYNPRTVVLVGDPMQLPAVVFSQAAKNVNYAQSLFQRLHSAGYPKLMLLTQYRMHREIADYPSKRFYDGKLSSDNQQHLDGVHKKQYHSHPSGRFRPFLIHNVNGEEIEEGVSIRNNEEVRYILELFESLTVQLRLESSNGELDSVGIIAPYRAQRIALQEAFAAKFSQSQQNVWPDYEIATIDGFQGREKDIVIFSACRASPHKNMSQDRPHNIGFLRDKERLNVAITRAKYAMWIVGHTETLGRDKETWSDLVNYARENGCIFDSTEFKSSRYNERTTHNHKETNRDHFKNNERKRKGTNSGDQYERNKIVDVNGSNHKRYDRERKR